MNTQINDWANVYRPKTFDEIIGQNATIKVLKNTLHSPFKAVIFHGASGTGKTSTAKVWAETIGGQLINIDGGVFNKVKDFQEYIKITFYKRLMPRTRDIIFVDEAQAISMQSFNALLSTIEAPTNNTVFIFCTTHINKIPRAIQSRCQSFHFKTIDDKELKNYLVAILQKENQTLSNEILDIIVKNSYGQVRNAIKLLQTTVQSSLTADELCEVIGIPTEKHNLIKYYLGKIGKKKNGGGEVRLPLALINWFYNQLQTQNINHQHDRENARNMAYLYACLCNEYQIRAEHPQTENDDTFFMDKSIWDKYNAGGKVKNRVKDLEDMGLIKRTLQKHRANNRNGWTEREHFFMNLDKLEEIYKQIA